MAETLTLDTDGFMRLVTEEHLQVEGPIAGYLYTGKRGKDGWEVYKTVDNPMWLYQARRINTQNGGGGGALVTRITMPAGCYGYLIALRAVGAASAGSALSVYQIDEDGTNTGLMVSIGAGASRTTSIPSIGQAPASHDTLRDSRDMLIGPGTTIVVAGTAALQTETQNVYIALLMNSKTVPTWDTTGSAGTPSLAASLISDANTWQLVPAVWR